MVAVKKAVLGTNQYCVVLNPVDSNGIPQLGKKEVRKGVADFFLHPGLHNIAYRCTFNV